jgi:beta-1,4-mannosyltransferase
MQMDVFCYPAGRKSIYIPLLFSGIRDRYEPVLGSSPDAAIARLRRGERAILHIHWEEFIFARRTTAEEANSAAAEFAAAIHLFKSLGGVVFWTAHNVVPHQLPYLEQFLEVRRLLAGIADAILLHNACSADLLRSQVELPPSRVHVVPHPAYLGLYEPEVVADAGIGAPSDRTLLCFGSVRRQKGFGRLIDMLPAPFLEARRARIRVSGTGSEARRVRDAHADRPDVTWDLRYVPMDEAPGLIRGSACVILPYETFLTSGVALLVLSVGGVLAAADAPQFREILPPASHRFLYRPGDAADARRVVDAVLALSAEDRAAIQQANLDVAKRYRAATVGPQLAALYDLALLRAATASRS